MFVQLYENLLPCDPNLLLFQMPGYIEKFVVTMHFLQKLSLLIALRHY